MVEYKLTENEKENVANMRLATTNGTLAILLVSMLLSAGAAEASLKPTNLLPPPTTPIRESGGKPTGTDCIGDGANCVGYINGSHGEVDVTNNTDQHAYWRFKLTCLYGGDQYGSENPPSADTVKSYLVCKSNAPAQYWNVIVDRKP